nr:MAG TPA: hypothetical protein [Caudoviricetes sp.]
MRSFFISPKIKGRINSFVPTILPFMIYYSIRVFIFSITFALYDYLAQF